NFFIVANYRGEHLKDPDKGDIGIGYFQISLARFRYRVTLDYTGTNDDRAGFAAAQMRLVPRVSQEGNFTGAGIFNGCDIRNEHLPVAVASTADIPGQLGKPLVYWAHLALVRLL